MKFTARAQNVNLVLPQVTKSPLTLQKKKQTNVRLPLN